MQEECSSLCQLNRTQLRKSLKELNENQSWSLNDERPSCSCFTSLGELKLGKNKKIPLALYSAFQVIVSGSPVFARHFFQQPNQCSFAQWQAELCELGLDILRYWPAPPLARLQGPVYGLLIFASLRQLMSLCNIERILLLFFFLPNCINFASES